MQTCRNAQKKSSKTFPFLLFAAPHGEKCRFDLPCTFWGSLKSKFWKVSQNMLILIAETLGLRHFPPDQLQRLLEGFLVTSRVQKPRKIR